MNDFKPKSICILGRQPKLGIAELESLYGAKHVKPIKGAALLDIPLSEMNFKRLGGILKLAQILKVFNTDDWQEILQYLIHEIPAHMQHQPSGKFTLGLSTYGLHVKLADQNKGLMALKRAIKSSGKSARIVPNKTPALNSAQVLHNKLTTKGAWELILIRNGKNVILAQTFFVQDIEAYAARDHARPRRDARVGMLPPKLAQIMINLANPANNGTVLDPFCGTGVVLQEALLMGFNVAGTDLDARMVLYSKDNIEWLKEKYPEKAVGIVNIERGNATDYHWQNEISVVVCETYLGDPLKRIPQSEELFKIAGNVNNLIKKFLTNIGAQIKPGTKLSLAVPLWRAKNGSIHLPVLENISVLGYNLLDLKHVEHKDLVYFREDQIVARQLIILEKK
jgi:tRNA G10  N-methylase Trm11